MTDCSRSAWSRRKTHGSGPAYSVDWWSRTPNTRRSLKWVEGARWRSNSIGPPRTNWTGAPGKRKKSSEPASNPVRLPSACQRRRKNEYRQTRSRDSWSDRRRRVGGSQAHRLGSPREGRLQTNARGGWFQPRPLVGLLDLTRRHRGLDWRCRTRERLEKGWRQRDDRRHRAPNGSRTGGPRTDHRRDPGSPRRRATPLRRSPLWRDWRTRGSDHGDGATRTRTQSHLRGRTGPPHPEEVRTCTVFRAERRHDRRGGLRVLGSRRGLNGHCGHPPLSLVASTPSAKFVVARLRLWDLGVLVGVVNDRPRSVLRVEFFVRVDVRPFGRCSGVARVEFIVEHLPVLRRRGGGPTRSA